MRFVVFSDLHLDTPFAWARREVAHARRQALRDTLVAIIALADEVDADAILSGGDLYEHDRFTPDTAAFLRDVVGATHRPVFLAPGNHDWYGRDSLYAQGDWPANVRVFTEAELRPVELADGLTLWGAAHLAPANTDGFLDRGFAVDRGGVHIALFHGSERAGFAAQRAEQETKQPHAPFDREQIPQAGLDHAFLGHYHRPADEPAHTYPGNPDPLTFGETGPRGVVIAEVGEDGSVERERRSVARSEVHDLTVDLTGSVSFQAVRERVATALDGLGGSARVTLTGEVHPDVEIDRRALDSLESLEAGPEQVVLRQRDLHVAYAVDDIAREETIRGRFVRDVLAAEDLDADEQRRVIATGLRALAGRTDLEVS